MDTMKEEQTKMDRTLDRLVDIMGGIQQNCGYIKKCLKQLKQKEDAEKEIISSEEETKIQENKVEKDDGKELKNNKVSKIQEKQDEKDDGKKPQNKDIMSTQETTIQEKEDEKVHGKNEENSPLNIPLYLFLPDNLNVTYFGPYFVQLFFNKKYKVST